MSASASTSAASNPVGASSAAPQLAGSDASGPGPWLEIPLLTARLLWRHWPALAFWFFAQRLCYGLLMDLAVKLGERSLLFSFAALSVLIVTQLAGTIFMFQSLRPSLPMLAGGAATPDTRALRQQWITSLAIALLPFFAYYVGWGLMEGLRRSFLTEYIFSVWEKEDFRHVLKLKGLWIALAVAWAVRWFSKRRATATGHASWTALATVCEAYWVFVGVAAIAQAIKAGQEWWHERAVYVAVGDWWESPTALFKTLAPTKRALAPVWDFVTTAAGAVALPLIWLAITAIVYGIDLRKAQRIDAADAPLERAVARFKAMHFTLRMLADKASAGWTSKGVPVVNSLRLVLRAGLPALLTLCVCWQLLAFLDSWSWRWMQQLVGPKDPAWQQVEGQIYAAFLNTPLSFRPSLFTDVLRVALLAATFDRAIARLPRSV
ncbi:putative membrane protein [Lysobacter enzymogenes]